MPELETQQQNFIDWLDVNWFLKNLYKDSGEFPSSDEEAARDISQTTEEWRFTFEKYSMLKSSIDKAKSLATSEFEMELLRTRVRGLLILDHIDSYAAVYEFSNGYYDQQIPLSIADQFFNYLVYDYKRQVFDYLDIESDMMNEINERIFEEKDILDTFKETFKTLKQKGYKRFQITTFMGALGMHSDNRPLVVEYNKGANANFLHIHQVHMNPAAQTVRLLRGFEEMRRNKLNNRDYIGISWLINERVVKLFEKVGITEEAGAQVYTGIDAEEVFRTGYANYPEWLKRIMRFGDIVPTSLRNISLSQTSLDDFLQNGNSPKVGVIRIPNKLFHAPKKDK